MKRVSKKTFVVLFLIFIVFSSITPMLAQVTGPDPANSPITEEDIKKRTEMIDNAVTMMLNIFAAFFRPVFQVLVGFTGKEKGPELMVRILIFFLVVVAVSGILAQIGIFTSHPSLNFWTGVLMAALGIRFLTTDFLQTMLYPTSALVAVIVVGLPFVIVGWFLMKQKPLMRRIGWITYLVLVGIIWLNNMMYGEGASQEMLLGNIAYMIIGMFIIAMLIADGTIRRWFEKNKLLGMQESVAHQENMAYLVEYKTALKALRIAETSGNQAEIKKQKGVVTRLKNLGIKKGYNV